MRASEHGPEWMQIARPGLTAQRSGFNAAVANTSGSSHAAKWPPSSTALKYVTRG